MNDKNCPVCETPCECIDVFDDDRFGDTLIEYGTFTCGHCGKEFVVEETFTLVRKSLNYK